MLISAASNFDQKLHIVDNRDVSLLKGIVEENYVKTDDENVHQSFL